VNRRTADELGLDADRWQAALEFADDLTRRDIVPALAIGVVRDGGLLGPFAFGRRRLAAHSPPLDADDRFVVASLTKPVVAMAVLRLAEMGKFSLNDRVSEFLPEYDDPPKRPTTLRHLLTHTSGLPDSLPTNVALRRAHAPLSRFVEGACAISLDFPPGRGVQYQSLGYALLGEIIARVSGKSCGEFLRDQFFEPLGMSDTSLGADAELSNAEFPDRLAEIRVPKEMEGGGDWNWNSAYWRRFGAPWGGLISTIEDLAKFCAMMLQGGRGDNGPVLSPAAVLGATTNQLDGFHDIPETDRRTRPWGFGWRLNWPAHAASFGDFLSPQSFGHWGATGTLFWIDPPRRLSAVLLSTQPLERERSPLIRLSNMIASSAE
jgi:CubicO group peptidase (beta-lactamase class C family)